MRKAQVKRDVVPIFPLKFGSWYDRFARMPRGPRMDMEGVPDKDREVPVNRLTEIAPKTGTVI